jgi:hypothetical protein
MRLKQRTALGRMEAAARPKIIQIKDRGERVAITLRTKSRQ